MKIALETVRQTLREALGFDSFAATFIRTITEDHSLPTAGITKDGRLSYNPQFLTEAITCKEDLFCLVFHELLHPMFNHFIFKSGPIENLAADAVINATISSLYPGESLSGGLFKRLYKIKGVEGLLRPMSRLHNSRFEATYKRLYGSTPTQTGLTTGELITALKALLPADDAAAAMLLGSHGSTDEAADSWPVEALEKIADELKHSAKKRVGQQAGYSVNLVEMLFEVLRSHISIKRQILRRFTTGRKVDRFKEQLRTQHVSSSPIPLRPSKKDLVLLACGFCPGSFHNQVTCLGIRTSGLAIYLDVSGSVNSYLPKILGILRGLKHEICSVYLFSNKVFEVPFATLLKGEIKTTGGTDFDCVAESIVASRLDKAVVITDGYASMKAANRARLAEQKVTMLTILFDRAQSCEALAKFGDVVQLADVCH